MLSLPLFHALAYMDAYREAVAQRGGFGGGSMAHRSREGSAGDAGSDGIDGALSTQSRLETQC